MPDLVPETGRLVGQQHHYPLRVYYEDTDAGGIVYHANYLRFAERARTEMMRVMGIPHAEMKAQDGVFFAVRRSVIDFHAPARLDDALDVESRILAGGGASLEIEQTIRHAGGSDRLVTITSKLACIDQALRPARLPGRLRAAIARHLSNSPTEASAHG